MTTIIEYQKVKQKNLLFVFQFERKDFYFGRNEGYVCTLDKCMSKDNWSDLYDKLNKRINKYMKNVEQPLDTERVEMRHAQLVLKIGFKPVTKPLVSLANLQMEDVYPYHIHVRVGEMSKVREYAEHVGKKEKSESGTSSRSHSRSRSQNGHSRSPPDEEYVPKPSEYPSGPAADAIQLTYTPSSHTSIEVKNEYTPEKVHSPNGASKVLKKKEIDYQAAAQYICDSPIEILSQSDGDRDGDNNFAFQGPTTSSSGTPMKFRAGADEGNCSYRTNTKSSSIFETNNGYDSDPPHHQHTLRPKRQRSEMKNDSPAVWRKPKRSQDMFEDNSEDDRFLAPRTRSCSTPKKTAKETKETDVDPFDFVANKRKRTDRDATMSSIKNVPKPKCDTPRAASKQGTIDGWCSKSRLKENSIAGAKDKANNNNTQRQKKRTATRAKNAEPKVEPKEEPVESVEEYNRKHQLKMDQLKEIQENLDRCNRPVTVDRMIDLKGIDVSDIIDTFGEHEAILLDLYTAYISDEAHRFKKATDYDHVVMHNMMLTRNQAHRMADALREKFFVSNDDYFDVDKVFFELLVPEWALAIFMKLYYMTRSEATEHIRKQDIVQSLNCSSFDLN